MKLSCTSENLQKGLSTVLRAVAVRPTLPILSNILLVTDKGRLRLSATDLEIGITTWIGSKIETDGSLTIPARLVSELIQSIRDDTINLRVDDHTLVITSTHITAEIAGQDAAEFPIIPTVKREQVIQVPAAMFKEGIRQVIFATALDETRPALTTLALRCHGKELKLIATDSYRLSEKTLPLAQPTPAPFTLLVPARSAHELERLINPSFDRVEIVAAENQALIRFGSVEMVSRLIDGQYPEYEAIIPKETTSTVLVETASMIDALKSTMIFAREVANQVSLGINEKQPKSITLSAQTSQIGGNTATIPADVSGGSLAISFNAKFVLDVLSVISADRVELRFNEPTTPLLIRPEKQAGYVAVVMPLKAG